METVMLCLLISAVVMRKSVADIPFMVRGKTPPSHELRMAELRRREGLEERRTAVRAAKAEARRARGRPGRDYLRALYDHSMTQAMRRRKAKWLAIDPVKAERYERRMADRATRMRDAAAARERGERVGLSRKAAAFRSASKGWLQRHNFVAGPASPERAPVTEASVDDAAPQETTTTTDDLGDGRDNRPTCDERRVDDDEEVQEPEPVMSAAEWLWQHAFAHAKSATDDAKFAYRYASGYVDRYADTPLTERPAHDAVCLGEWLEYLRDRSRTSMGQAPEQKTDAALGAMKGTAPGADQHIPTQEGNRMSAATGETTTLSQTIASIEAWEKETQNAIGSLEMSMASLEGAEVGPSVTGAIAEAREAFATAAAAFAKAKGALEPSQQIGDLYNSAPDAGSKEFVKN
ncbi:hypothetical protein ABN028_15990 [Actinopolymorpha sp. B17G11]|uniref:hypothetical protein n=1 Tax=Actinopolymorpha sp. B17G11 TaxID=3160861 RepID=UPI0032E48DEB